RSFYFFSLLLRPPPCSYLFPYTTLFRSRGLFLRQVGNCDFHRAIYRDSGKAFVLIDPSVRCELLLRFFVQRFQLFHTLFCACFFVITCARRRSDDREHDETEQNEEAHNSEPRRKWRARVGNTVS